MMKPGTLDKKTGIIDTYLDLHVERGWRGHVEYTVKFRWSGTADIIFNWINSDRQNRRAARGLRRARKHLMPAINMWIHSDYKYIIDVHDFVIATLGTARGVRVKE